jgi:carbonic anhydrase
MIHALTTLTVTAILMTLAQGALADAQSAYPATPGEALARLQAGNERFIRGETIGHDYLNGVKSTAAGQQPFAAIISCLDSRVPPEIVFDQGIGDVFVGRIAGNYVDTDLLGSLEFATAVVGAKLIVVLGHTDCGAVKGACDNVQLGNLTHTLSNLAPAVYSVRGFAGSRTSGNGEFVSAVTHANVDLNVRGISERSAVIAELVAAGKVNIIGAVYDVASGQVHFQE